MPRLTVTALNVYPVKSMRGIALAEATLTAEGLQHDRRWMVVRENGRFVTQRDFHRLALIETALTPEGVRLTLPDFGHTILRWESDAGQKISTQVWKERCETIAEAAEVSAWLTAGLHSTDRLHLVRMAPGFRRVNGQPQVYGTDTHTVFADAAPYLVANENSLAALNAEAERQGLERVSMNRFRPNIVIAGLEAFGEHGVGGIAGPGYTLRFCFPCERCVVTTIDQETARRDPGRHPFLTLRDLNPMPGNPSAPAFAENSTLAAGEGRGIRVGDPLATFARG